MSTYAIRFSVIGELGFPLDMLRYDGCYPADQEAVGALADSLDARVRMDERVARQDKSLPLFRVRLIALTIRKDWNPTEARWRSFSWQVEPGSIRKDKLA